MEKFLVSFNFYVSDNLLKLSESNDYLADKLKYLDEIYKNDKLRFILLNITGIKYGHNQITTLEWLKYFPNVTRLYCPYNNLDPSSLESLKYVPKLQTLCISNNNIDDLSNLKFVPDLRKLYCSSNKIKKLPSADVSLLKLEVLNCPNNELTFIDTSNYISLESINCSFNQLTNLDVSQCKELVNLSCKLNSLTKLNLQGLTKLRDVYCYSNKLTSLVIKECKKLTDLNCCKNQLAVLDLLDISSLENLLCDGNQLISLDLSNCLRLKQLSCINNKIAQTKDIKNISMCLNLEEFRHDKTLLYIDYQYFDECYICSDNLKDSEQEKKIITHCRHVFHEVCLISWINVTTIVLVCPYCRQII